MPVVTRRLSYRIYPDKAQRFYLANAFGCARYVWNYMLDYFNQAYQASNQLDPANRIYYNLDSASTILTALKNSASHAWLSAPPRDCTQQSIRDLDVAFRRFKSRSTTKSGYPRKKKRTSRQTAHFFHSTKGFSIRNNRLKLGKLKTTIKVRWKNRPLPSQPKTATIIKTSSGHYYASFTCTWQLDNSHMPDPGLNHVGVDMGLIDIITTSGNVKIPNPRHYDKKQARRARYQRRLARQKKGSKSYRKNRTQLAKLECKIANQRKDYIHKLTTSLVKDNKAICIEDLNVAGMAKHPNYGKSIMHAGWGMFRQFLEYKVRASKHTVLVVAHPQFPSTKLCSNCNTKHKEAIHPKYREWECPNCHTILDRDYNAAYNLRDLIKQCPGDKLNTPGSIIPADLYYSVVDRPRLAA